MKEIEQLIRPALLNLKPYSSARDEFQGDAEIYIDANENPFGVLVNRYPDPLQKKLKGKIAKFKHIPFENIFIGNGSDEVLDLIFRLFCIPGQDGIVITPPTYGMYKVLAGINDVFVQEAPLSSDFQINAESILKISNRKTKILFLCSPNNPAGISLRKEDILKMVKDFSGIVVLDEAYIDFSQEESLINYVNEFPNLIVTQTFSKAWGLAGIRVGMAFAHPFLVEQLNKIKPPYNVNILSQNRALQGLEEVSRFQENLSVIKLERNKLFRALNELPMVKKVYESDANFLLTEFDDADKYYHYLVQKGVIVRNRSRQKNCENCLRITVGTPDENTKLIQILSS